MNIYEAIAHIEEQLKNGATNFITYIDEANIGEVEFKIIDSEWNVGATNIGTVRHSDINGSEDDVTYDYLISDLDVKNPMILHNMCIRMVFNLLFTKISGGEGASREVLDAITIAYLLDYEDKRKLDNDAMYNAYMTSRFPDGNTNKTVEWLVTDMINQRIKYANRVIYYAEKLANGKIVDIDKRPDFIKKMFGIMLYAGIDINKI